MMGKSRLYLLIGSERLLVKESVLSLSSIENMSWVNHIVMVIDSCFKLSQRQKA